MNFEPEVYKSYSKEELNQMPITEINRIAMMKMEYQIVKLFYTDMALLGIWTLVDRKPTINVKLFGFDVKSHPATFVYNPYFVNMASDKFMEYIIFSQGLKFLLRHCSTRQLADKPRHAIASNLAINSILVNNNNSELKDMIAHVSQYSDFDIPSRYKFDDKLTLEEYYLLLEGDANGESRTEKMIGSKGDGKGDKQGEGDVEGEEGCPFDSQGDAEGQGLNNLDNENWEENEMVDADVKNFVSRAKDSNKSWGNVTGGIIDVILVAHLSPVNWRRMVRHFAKTVEAKRTINTRSKANRRTEFVDPGYRREFKSKILVAIDTSGSISDSALSEAFSVVKDACKHSQIDYTCWDVKIANFEKNINKRYKHSNKYKVAGRGGTDVQCVFELADKEHYDGVVVITDGYFSKPSGPTRTATKYIWLMEKGNYNKSITDIIPVGRIFEMEKDGKQLN